MLLLLIINQNYNLISAGSGGFLNKVYFVVMYRTTSFLLTTLLLLVLLLLQLVNSGEAVDYADIGRSDFSCGSNGQVLYSNLTVCQLEELQLCPSDYYPQFDAYLRPLSCPLPHCNPDG